ARPADLADRRPLEQHRLGLAGPQLPRRLRVAGDRRRLRRRRAAREPARLPRRDEDPHVPHGRCRFPQRPVLRHTRRLDQRERDHVKRLHGQPGRGRMALRARLAPVRQPLHVVGAPRAAARRPEAPRLSRARAVRARAHPAERDMRLTRRRALTAAAAGAVGATGIYELVDRLSGGTPKRAANPVPLPEQHLLDGVRVVRSDGVEVLVPPLHHEVLTAVVDVDRAGVADARGELERVLAGLEADYVPSPAGLGVTLGWGLPYFHRLVPEATRRLLPHDRRADRPVVFDAERFPSDPPETRLESNDVAIVLRSDVRAHIDDAVERLRASKLLHLTSIRRGFAGGGFEGQGGLSLPKQMATAAGIPGADLIPDRAELFLGFTSTQKAGIGPGAIANFETLGYVDFRGSDYFRHGTHMHLSHIVEDVEAWYLNFDFDERIATMFRPHLAVKQGVQTVRQAPQDVSSVADVH